MPQGWVRRGYSLLPNGLAIAGFFPAVTVTLVSAGASKAAAQCGQRVAPGLTSSRQYGQVGASSETWSFSDAAASFALLMA